MEYNTDREKIEIMDYGRNVYKLVRYAKSIEDRERRTQVAEAIVGVMAQVNPHVRDHADYRHKLWDHLMVLAGGDLDVDTPFVVNHSTSVRFEPKKLDYSDGDIRQRHFGRMLERMIEKVSTMPEGEERTALEGQLAECMKRNYLAWNRDTVSDDVIIEQMDNMSGGRIRIAAGTEINLPADSGIQPDDISDRKKKKKKKK